MTGDRLHRPTRIVCLAASADRVEAVQQFFDELPNACGAAFVVVLHASPDINRLTPQFLSQHTDMPVVAVTDGIGVQPGHVYVLPAGNTLMFDGHTLRRSPHVLRPARPTPRPMDMFLADLAHHARTHAVAVLFSGSDPDGNRGVQDIKAGGGTVWALRPAFDEMRRSGIDTALVDYVGDAADLATRMMRLSLAPDVSDGGTVEDVLTVLREHTGTDHRAYRIAMLDRRIRRRMTRVGIGQLDAYCTRLRTDGVEVDTLRQDLLIGVTRFFRDPWAYQTLRDKALVEQVKRADSDQPLRIWVTACSTGQEAYSLAILLTELIETTGRDVRFTIWATDANEQALEHARHGIYSSSDIADIPAHYVTRYFEPRGDAYVVRASIRNTIHWAVHNVVSDPPFTQMDLVSCRNLLIYLTSEAQRRVLNALHLALKPDRGILFLGTAEVPTGLQAVIQPVDERSRIFRRSGNAMNPQTGLPVCQPVCAER